MRKVIKTAKTTHEDKEYIGKRVLFLADSLGEAEECLKKNKISTSPVDLFNSKVVVEVQNAIRQAILVKYGLKEVKVAGEAKDLSAIEEV